MFHGKGVPEETRKDREAFARWVLDAPMDALLSIAEVIVDEPEPARVHNSLKCAICGESVMETRTRQIDGRAVCIPCAEERQQGK